VKLIAVPFLNIFGNDRWVLLSGVVAILKPDGLLFSHYIKFLKDALDLITPLTMTDV
jgi:hypothetical protein